MLKFVKRMEVNFVICQKRQKFANIVSHGTKRLAFNAKLKQMLPPVY